MTISFSDSIIDVVENFTDTCPELEDVSIKFGERMTGENDTVRMIIVELNDDRYLVKVKKIGAITP